MAFLNDDELDTLLQMHSIRSALLIELNFSTETCYIWTGAGPLTIGGITWRGTGQFISVSGLEQLIGTNAIASNILLSGVDPDLVRIARENDNELRRGTVVIYGQLFDDYSQPLGSKFHLMSGNMSKLSYKAEGPSNRQIDMPVEGLFSRRNRPRFGLFTHSDQQRRHPDDLGLEYIETLVDKTVTWPDY